MQYQEEPALGFFWISIGGIGSSCDRLGPGLGMRESIQVRRRRWAQGLQIRGRDVFRSGLVPQRNLTG